MGLFAFDDGRMSVFLTLREISIAKMESILYIVSSVQNIAKPPEAIRLYKITRTSHRQNRYIEN